MADQRDEPGVGESIDLDEATRTAILERVSAALDGFQTPATYEQIHGAVTDALMGTIGIIGGGLPGDPYTPEHGTPPPGAPPRAV